MNIRQRVTDIWKDVLGLDDAALARGGDFFEAGGDSFAVVDFATRVKNETGVEVPLEIVFMSGSLAQVLEECERLASGVRVGIDAS